MSTILDLSPSSHRVLAYPGNFSSYLAQFLKEQEKQSAAYRDQQIEIRRMKQDIVRTKEQARHVEITTTPRQPGVRRIAKKVAAKAKSREKKLDRYLESDERIERPKPSWKIKLEFASPGKLSGDVLSTEKLAVGYVGEAPLLTDLKPAGTRRRANCSHRFQWGREDQPVSHHRGQSAAIRRFV